MGDDRTSGMTYNRLYGAERLRELRDVNTGAGRASTGSRGDILREAGDE